MLIGIAGPKGSGKSTAAKLLTRKHAVDKPAIEVLKERAGYWWRSASLLQLDRGVQVEMADDLKTLCQLMFDIPYKYLWGPSKLRDRYDHTLAMLMVGRSRMQPRLADAVVDLFTANCLTPRRILRLVGDAYREDNPNHWVELVEPRIKKLLREQEERLVVVTGIRYVNEAMLIQRLGGKTLMMRNPHTLRAPDHSSEEFDFDVDDEILNPGELRALKSRLDNTLSNMFSSWHRTY